MGLQRKLTISLLVPLVVIIGLHGVIRVRQEQIRLEENSREAFAERTRRLTLVVEAALRGPDSELRAVLQQLVDGQQDDVRIRVFGPGVSPIAAAGVLHVGDAVSAPPLQRVLERSRAEQVSEAYGDQIVFSAIAPLRNADGVTVAAAEFTQVMTGMKQRIRDAVWDIWARLGLIAVAVSLVMAAVLKSQVFDRLAELTRAMRDVGAQREGARLPVDRRDELGRVAEVFNEMAAELERAREHLRAEAARAFELQQQLRHADRLTVVGRLASALAHEVGTPLNIISGHVEMVLDNLPLGDTMAPHMRSITQQIRRITGIIQSVLDTVRPQSHAAEPVALARVLEGLWPLMQHAARSRGVRLITSLPDDLPLVLGDANQLQQVLVNLVMNSLEACTKGDHVSVSADASDRKGVAGVCLSVADSGPGVPPEHRARVFDPFFTTKPPGHGTGLGLAISRDIVRDHGGEIWLEASGSEGTRMSVWLPCGAASTAEHRSAA